VVVPSVKVEVGMGRFTVHSIGPEQCLVSCKYLCLRMGGFGLHGELNALVDTVQVVQKSFSLLGPCGQMTKMSSM
jgi:hypothetical protein